jgi:hypothetical protein
MAMLCHAGEMDMVDNATRTQCLGIVSYLSRCVCVQMYERTTTASAQGSCNAMRTFEALSTIEGRFLVSLQVAEAISFAYELSDLIPSFEFLISMVTCVCGVKVRLCGLRAVTKGANAIAAEADADVSGAWETTVVSIQSSEHSRRAY